MQWLFRHVVRQHIKSVTVEEVAGRLMVKLSPGELEVRTPTGGTRTLPFEYMFNLDANVVQGRNDGDEFLELVKECWSDMYTDRTPYEFKDGLTLCDMTHVLRGQWNGVALLQFGQLRGWWRVVYDEHALCPHASEGKCDTYCTVYIDQFKQPPRRIRKKKKRRKVEFKLRLPELFPERGVVIAH